jgi:class 3 adenylate cyclase/tetratricopeptide (TPR) repeat protein
MNCPSCHAEAAPGARFCSACGAPLARAPAATASPRPAAGEALTEDRRTVSILFTDLEGSTAITQRADPEDAWSFKRTALRAMEAVIVAHGGTVAKHLGDGLMALFGAPVAQPDHAVRACRAALALQPAVAEAMRGRAGTSTVPRVRAGIDSGTVVISWAAAAPDADGPAVDRAKRTESIAEAGAPYITEETWRRAAPTINADHVGARRIKGFDERVVFYRLRGMREINAPHGEQRTPFIGRTGERSRLIEHVRVLASSGTGCFALVSGAPGVGKTRLLEEVRAETTNFDVRWLESRSASFLERLSFWPIIEVIRGQAGISSGDDPAAAWRRLENSVQEIAGDETPEILPFIGMVLDLAMPEPFAERVRLLDTAARPQQIHRACRMYFEKLARHRPTVLVFDDLHSMDQSSSELIAHLLRLVATVPLMICGIALEEDAIPTSTLRQAAEALPAGRFVSLSLPPLAEAEERALFRSIVALDERAASLVDAVRNRTEGNPLFIEGIIQGFIESGTLRKSPQGDRWIVTRPVSEIVIPESIRDMLLERIDRLGEPLRNVLRHAAVIGRTFLYRVLGAIAQHGHELDRRLDALKRGQFIDEKMRLPEIEYMFKHALVHQTVYERILQQHRRELHRRVAECLETLFPDRLDELCGQLAAHYSRAEIAEKAQHYLFKAGDRATRLAGDSEALLHYQEGVEAYAKAFGARWEPTERASVERRLGEIRWRRGDAEAAHRHMRAALSLLGSWDPRGRPALFAGIAAEAVRQAAHRAAPALFVRSPVAALSASDSEKARLFELLAWTHYLTDQTRLFFGVLRSLNFAESRGYPEGAAKGYAAIGYVCDVLGLFRPGLWYHRRSLEQAALSGNPACIGLVHNCMGLYTAYTGDWAEALRCYEVARVRSREAGDWTNWGSATAQINFLLSCMGRFEEALERAREMVKIGEETAFGTLIYWGLMGEGKTLWRQGRFTEAHDILRRAITAATKVGDHQCLSQAHGEIGRCLAAMGETDEGYRVLREARDTARAHMVLGHNITDVVLGLAAIELRRCEQGAVSSRLAARAVRAALHQGRRVRAGAPEAMRLAGTLAWLRGQPAEATRCWDESERLAERLDARREIALTRLETGQRLGRGDDLQRAERMFVAMDAAVDAARAREALGRV